MGDRWRAAFRGEDPERWDYTKAPEHLITEKGSPIVRRESVEGRYWALREDGTWTPWDDAANDWGEPREPPIELTRMLEAERRTAEAEDGSAQAATAAPEVPAEPTPPDAAIDSPLPPVTERVDDERRLWIIGGAIVGVTILVILLALFAIDDVAQQPVATTQPVPVAPPVAPPVETGEPQPTAGPGATPDLAAATFFQAWQDDDHFTAEDVAEQQAIDILFAWTDTTNAALSACTADTAGGYSCLITADQGSATLVVAQTPEGAFEVIFVELAAAGTPVPSGTEIPSVSPSPSPTESPSI